MKRINKTKMKDILSPEEWYSKNWEKIDIREDYEFFIDNAEYEDVTRYIMLYAEYYHKEIMKIIGNNANCFECKLYAKNPYNTIFNKNSN